MINEVQMPDSTCWFMPLTIYGSMGGRKFRYVFDRSCRIAIPCLLGIFLGRNRKTANMKSAGRQKRSGAGPPQRKSMWVWEPGRPFQRSKKTGLELIPHYVSGGCRLPFIRPWNIAVLGVPSPHPPYLKNRAKILPQVPQVPSCPLRRGLVQGWESVC